MITNNTKAGKGGRRENHTILEYRSWVIEETPTCIVLRKRSDVRDTHVGYFSSIESALSRLFEILLQKNAKSGKGAKNIGSLRNAILETRQEFENILSIPKDIDEFDEEEFLIDHIGWIDFIINNKLGITLTPNVIKKLGGELSMGGGTEQ